MGLAGIDSMFTGDTITAAAGGGFGGGDHNPSVLDDNSVIRYIVQKSPFHHQQLQQLSITLRGLIIIFVWD